VSFLLIRSIYFFLGGMHRMKDTLADFGRIEATIPDDLWMGDVFFFRDSVFWKANNTSAGKCFTRLKGKLTKQTF